MTVKTLLASLDSKELSEWQAYLNLEFYENKIKQQRMNSDERSDAILNTIFGDPSKWQKP